VLTYLKTLYNMRAADDEDIPEYINKMKLLVDKINVMNELEIDNKTLAGTILQSLPAAWDAYVDGLHHTSIAQPSLNPVYNITQLIRNLKDEYQ
jgi:hypothetical protein